MDLNVLEALEAAGAPAGDPSRDWAALAALEASSPAVGTHGGYRHGVPGGQGKRRCLPRGVVPRPGERSESDHQYLTAVMRTDGRGN